MAFTVCFSGGNAYVVCPGGAPENGGGLRWINVHP